MNPERRAWIILFGLAIGLALAAAPAARAARAQDGDPETQWMSYLEGLEMAVEKGTGVLMYFPADGQLVDVPVFRDRDVAALSHEIPFVKIAYEPHQPMRQKFELTEHTTIVVTDWFGNLMKKMPLRPPVGKFNSKQVVQTLQSVPALVKALDEKLEKSLEKVPTAIKRKKFPAALKAIDRVLDYKGYPAAKKAEELQKKVYETGESLVKEAVEYA